MPAAMSRENIDFCPCGSEASYACCCRPLHEGVPAPDAEALMRSRYSAYVLNLSAYIKSSWHPSTYDNAVQDDVVFTQWLGLQVKRHRVIDERQAEVEFVARYKQGGRAFRLHEVSRFVHENGRWLYVDGEFVGRR